MPTKMIEQILRDTKIYQIERPKVMSTSSKTSIKDALALMQEQKAGYIIVTDSKKKVLGMFTERDVLIKIMQKGISLDVPIEQYMSKNPMTINREDNISNAIKVMEKNNVRHIPRVDKGGKMTGVLSIRTVVNFLTELFPTEIFNLPPNPEQIHDTVEGG